MTPDQKLEIVLQHIAGEASAIELCHRHGIRSTKTLYNWRDRLMASAEEIFRERRGAPRSTNLRPAEIEPGRHLEAPEAADPSDEFFEDDESRELEKLFGVSDAEIERQELVKNLPRKKRRTKPKSRAESARGRSSLKRVEARISARAESKSPSA